MTVVELMQVPLFRQITKINGQNEILCSQNELDAHLPIAVAMCSDDNSVEEVATV